MLTTNIINNPIKKWNTNKNLNNKTISKAKQKKKKIEVITHSHILKAKEKKKFYVGKYFLKKFIIFLNKAHTHTFINTYAFTTNTNKCV